ncbi:hypothetical protein JNW93_13705 [Lacticaseibacillus rhamnosus]|uniref:hypothetical protein n=1 Tax=Lacticaseibacillus rhamnosus TaxID=47715 RepID=UPI001952122E|nr:hypothetical protein [Lacticaseibacillus rhamnosus]MBM6441693.1 hypothetical protein [Lacticaseibacillus rhamnosus]
MARSQDQKRVVTASIVVFLVVSLVVYFAESFGIKPVWWWLLYPVTGGLASGLTFYVGHLKDKKL